MYTETFDAAYKEHVRREKKNQKKRKRDHFSVAEGDEDTKRAKKARPNYFVSVQITNPRVCNTF